MRKEKLFCSQYVYQILQVLSLLVYNNEIPFMLCLYMKREKYCPVTTQIRTYGMAVINDWILPKQ